MKKLFFAGALCMMLCVCATGMAGTMFNVCLSKECLTEQEAANQAIQTKPEGFKVTRQSVIPWNDAGERWSVLVELENVSEEAIVIDDTWLIACNAREEELVRWSVPAIDGAFWKTNRTVRPGERVVLFAGTDEVKTWITDWETKETVEKTVSPAGLGAVAEKIRQAARLQVQFDARVASETKGHLEKVEAAKAWIADGSQGFYGAQRHRHRFGRAHARCAARQRGRPSGSIGGRLFFRMESACALYHGGNGSKRDF